MVQKIKIEPLTTEAFKPYGEVIEVSEIAEKILINQGNCARFHDLAMLDFTGKGARAGISLFQGQPYDIPMKLEMMERHPLGSQAFIPMSPDPFLVIVALDRSGPSDIRAFITQPNQGVNYARNTWHGVLTPLKAPRLFAVIDRIGEGNNLDEHWFENPPLISH